MSELYEEFNKWWNNLDEDTRWDIDKYSAMRGWSARQTHVKVELPKEKIIQDQDTYYGCFYDVQELEDALDKAGVRY